MTPLTEADLLRMREVQAKPTKGPWERCGCGKCGHIHSVAVDAMILDAKGHIHSCKTEGFPHAVEVEDNIDFVCAARTDWPRVTEWALEARDLIRRLMPKGHMSSCQLDAHGPGSGGTCTCGYAEARGLLGDP